jgi:hypothetical protein
VKLTPGDLISEFPGIPGQASIKKVCLQDKFGSRFFGANPRVRKNPPVTTIFVIQSW